MNHDEQICRDCFRNLAQNLSPQPLVLHDVRSFKYYKQRLPRLSLTMDLPGDTRFNTIITGVATIQSNNINVSNHDEEMHLETLSPWALSEVASFFRNFDSSTISTTIADFPLPEAMPLPTALSP